jgi:hypothetical protein
LRLSQIKWNNRYVRDNGSECKVTIDGTDFRINEPSPFDPKWYSHKFRGAGVRYEVGVGIQTGWIVWVNGPFPCGTTDLQISRSWLIEELDDGEKFLADGGYNDGGQYSETPNGLNNDDQRMKAAARARHETVNSRFKEFAILSQRYRHNLMRHGTVFMAVANITQLAIVSDRPLFSIQYNDRLQSRR